MSSNFISIFRRLLGLCFFAMGLILFLPIDSENDYTNFFTINRVLGFAAAMVIYFLLARIDKQRRVLFDALEVAILISVFVAHQYILDFVLKIYK